MKTNHTSGPWKVVATEEQAASNANPFDVYARDHQRIALITNWDPEANAKLIAAAPELLEALMAMKNEFVNRQQTHNNKTFPKRKEAYDKMLAAIEKATK